MKQRITLMDRFRYKFDNLMSRGTGAMIGFLGILSLLIITVAGLIFWYFSIAPDNSSPMSFGEGVWQSLMRTMDAGTIAGDSGWTFRFISIIITLGGIFILSTLIGILSSGIEVKLEQLRKGKSFVIEQNHTLILGWSTKVFTIISELIVAGENQKSPRVVILSEKDKVEMEDEIREKIPVMKNMKVICRTGSPSDLTSLAIVNPHQAKSIIILTPEEGDPDAQVIKTILAITNNPNRRKEPYHIIAEIKNFKNIEVAKMVGKDEVELILADDIFARIMVQTSRQSGLSIVYQELMDFDGDEIYFNEEPKLIGKTFAESLFVYKTSSVMGIQYANGTCQVNPPMDYIFKEGDKVIAITEDDDTMIISDKTNFNIYEESIVHIEEQPKQPEKTLIIGWNNRGPILIKELDQYLKNGSYIKIVSDYEIEQSVLNTMSSSLKNITIDFIQAETTSKEVIDSLDVTSFDNVQVLCYNDRLPQQEADAITLIILLHLRRISSEKNSDIKIVSEMLDIRNRDLASVTKVNDFIISDKIISLMMSQISENKHLMRVFEDLLRSEGSEIYLKPAENYINKNTEIDFYTVVESAKRRNEIAIGYKIAKLSNDSTQSFGVVVNPDKSLKISFDIEDKIIVLAED
ncbi:MAG TPA: hypothetical protein PLL66_09595 [Bacteroidales bacterium]|nr:hypothetical protein [Bacteroidales bacterium]